MSDILTASAVHLTWNESTVISSATRVGLSSLAIAVMVSVGIAPSSFAEPSGSQTSAPTPGTAGTDGGRGVIGSTTAAFSSPQRAAQAAQQSLRPVGGIAMPDSYPAQPPLTVYPDPPNDSTRAAGGELTAYDDIAPMLDNWMRTSDRISTQVVGRSSQGRDLYLVTVTAPETPAETARQAAWKDKIKNAPVAAAADVALQAGYKTPIWFTGNIQGNEWEGTDAQLQVIKDLVEAPYAQVRDTLLENRLYFSLSLNPDARVIGQRPTTLGLDPNRDMITAITPEAESFGQVAQAVQSFYMADLHGYTNVLQVEPTGPPHGENYEYDLFIPQGYAVARAIEDAVVGANIPGNWYFNTSTGQPVPTNTGPDTAHIKIPYRDTPQGWDDYPPVFSAQYAAYFGSVTSTVELPRPRAGTGGTQTAANAIINKSVGKLTIDTTIAYVDQNSDDMLDNQIEFFRRGVSGEPKVALTTANIAAVPGPAEWKALWDVADDQDPVVLPRAYVIPAGATQRSASDAATLVNRLLAHGIEVGTLDTPTTVGGAAYPAGSYVVDLNQPLRALANALLDLGSDISDKVPTMYDISAWSYSYLWGATVDKIGLVTDPDPVGPTTPISAAVTNASVAAGAGYLSFDVAGVGDVRALNALLEEGVEVSLLDNGSAIVGPDDLAAVRVASAQHGVAFTSASAAEVAALDDPGTRGLTDLTVGYVGNATVNEDWLALSQLGFDDLQLLNAASINANPAVLDTVDILWVGSNLTFNGSQGAGSAAVQAWVDAGGSIVGRGSAGFNTAKSFGLMTGTAVAGNGLGNGIVAVDTPAESVLAPFEQDTAFVYPATWFTGLGAEVTTEQTYDAGDPLLAGHWRPSGAGVNGPANAAGQPSVVSAEAASGARSLVFGTSVFFRSHPKGGMSQGARALFWAGPDGAGVGALAPAGPPVVTTPTGGAPAASTVVLKATKVRATIGRNGTKGKVRARVTLAIPGLSPVGTITISERGRVLKRVTVTAAGTERFRLFLTRGRHKLTATYAGGPQVIGSKDSTRLRIR